jgi:hypothetical protein
MTYIYKDLNIRLVWYPHDENIEDQYLDEASTRVH